MRGRRFFLWGIGGIVGALAFAGAPAGAADYQVWLDREAEGRRLAVTGYCLAPASGSLTYSLRALKRGGGGNVSTSQEGRVMAREGLPSRLSRMALESGPGSTVEVGLRLYREGVLVAETSQTYPAEEE